MGKRRSIWRHRDGRPKPALIMAILAGVVLVAGAVTWAVVVAMTPRSDIAERVASYTPVPQSTRERVPVALVIGDSQANGAAGVDAHDTWVSTTLRAEGYNPVISGYGGTGFLASREASSGNPGHAGILESLESDLYDLPANPDVIFVEAGGNDNGYQLADIESAANRTLDILAEKYPGVRVIVVGPLVQVTEGAEKRQQISDLLGTVAAARGLAFVNTSAWVSSNDLAQYLADDRHFTSEGHAKLAELFKSALNELGVTSD